MAEAEPMRAHKLLYQGYAAVERHDDLFGAITVRADIANAQIRAALVRVCGAGIPKKCGVVAAKGAVIAWLSPDELLILCAPARVKRLVDDLQKALKGLHALVLDMSDARAVFSLSGDKAREVLGKLSPADISTENFPKGTIRRTRLAQVPVAFWLGDENLLYLLCFRSVADYVFDILSYAARPGSEVYP